MEKYYEKLCKSWLIPLAPLPVLSILSSLGFFFFNQFHWDSILFFSNLEVLYVKALPLLIAASSSFFFSNKKDGSVLLSAIISYIIFSTILNPITFQEALNDPSYQLNLFFEYIKSPFGGLLCGLLSAFLFNKFSETRLPQALSFFSGRRLVPIITAGISIFLTVIIYFVWPPLVKCIFSIPDTIQFSPIISASMLTLIEKILMPFGIIYPSFINPPFYITLMRFIIPLALIILYKYTLPEKKKEYLFLFIATGITCLLSNNVILFDVVMLAAGPLIFIVHIFLLATIHAIISISGIETFLFYITMSIVYNYILYWVIKKFHISFLTQTTHRSKLPSEKLQLLFQAFGGIENIISFVSINNTQIEVNVIDVRFVDYSIFPNMELENPTIETNTKLCWNTPSPAIELVNDLNDLYYSEMKFLKL